MSDAHSNISGKQMLRVGLICLLLMLWGGGSLHAEEIVKQERKQFYTGKKFITFEGREVTRKEATLEYLGKINEEIKQLQVVLKSKTDPQLRADINHRIADNLKKAGKVRYFIAVDRYEKEYKKYQKKQIKKKPSFPRENYSRAIKRFQAILARYPEYRKTDEVLFELGGMYAKMGKPTALRYFEQLTRRFPTSRYSLESEFAKAEFYFEKRELNKATRSFRAVMAYGDTELYNQALYKLAWCYYNQGRRRQAVETLKQVVAKARKTKREADLREESLNDLVIFYSEIEGATEEAEAYFARMGKPGLTKKVLNKLSSVYYDQARWEKAINMYRKLIKFDPRHPDVPNFHAKIITAYRKSGDMKQSLQEMENYIDRYYVQKAPWARYNGKNKEALEKVETESEKYLRFICKYHHQGAQKNKNQQLYAVAATYYEKYLKYFPRTEQAYEMRYFYAEILFQLARYEDAGEQYELVAKADPKGKYLKPSSYAAVLCWDTLEKKEFEKLETLRKQQRKDWQAMMAQRKMGAKEIAPPEIDTRPIKPSPYALRLIAASQNYVKWNPRDKKIPEIAFNVPKNYYNYNQFPQALSGFKNIIRTFPRSQVAVFSRNLVLDIYNLQQDWDNLRLWATNFLNDRYFGAKNRSYLLGLIQGAMFKKAIVLENDKKFLDSANLYVELTDNYPNSKLAEKALYNSAINFMLAGRPDLAIANSRRFISRFPKSPLVEKTMLGLARYFENLADFTNAAEYYEMLAFRVPRSTHAADSLYNAGLYRENLGQYSKARKDYDEFIRRYKKSKPKDAGELFFAKGLMAEKLKQWKDAGLLYRDYPNLFNDPDRVLESIYRRGEMFIARGMRAQGERQFRSAKALYEKYKKDRVRLKGGKKYVAKAELRLTAGLVRDYDNVKFVMPQRQLARSIERKAQLLKQLRDRYMLVIGYGDAEAGIEALYRIGKAYQKFASALFSAPVPKNLQPEEVDLYMTELEKRAKPIEGKAVEAFLEAVQKSFKLGILTSYTRLAYEQLSQYKPAEYPIHRGLRIAQTQTASALYSYRPVYQQGRQPALNLSYKKPEGK